MVSCEWVITIFAATENGNEVVWVDKEIWKDIHGYENWYQVSNHGNVRRIAPVNGCPRCKNLTPWIGERGYCNVTLNVSGSRKVFRVHRLVAEHFIGSPDAWQTDVNHIDGNKKNNTVSNLEWCTRSENMIHAYKMGLQTKGRYLVKKYAEAI